MKRIIYILIITMIAISALSYPISAHDMPEDISVHDFSGVLSDGVKDYIRSKNDIMLSQTGSKIIFVMTENSGEQSITEFCENLYTSWGVSGIGRRNSVFIVADTKKEEYAFLIGRGIRLALTESEMYEILVDYFEPDFAKESYDIAVFKTYNAIAGWYEEKYNNASFALEDDVFKFIGGEKVKDFEHKTSMIWIWIALGVVLIFIIVVLKIKRNIELKMRQHERRRLRKKFKIDIDKITNS